jgi:hypothetical protein
MPESRKLHFLTSDLWSLTSERKGCADGASLVVGFPIRSTRRRSGRDLRRGGGVSEKRPLRHGQAVRDTRTQLSECLRKEVIQPQVPLRLPCYDFTPVADLTVDGCLSLRC